MTAPRVERIQIPEGHAGTVATLQVMQDAVGGGEGAHNTEVRHLAMKIVEGLPPKAYEREVRAIYDFMREHVRYTLDPRGLEWVQTPWYTLLVAGMGDCFEEGTLVLRREGYELVAVEDVKVGDEIWGLDRWSRVENTWDRGSRETVEVSLNNGSKVRLTPEHKAWIGKCRNHPYGHRCSRPCSCPMSSRDLVRVKIDEFEPGMVLAQPEKIEGETGRSRNKLLRVKSVNRDGAVRKCFDLATDDHYVWLPEFDWTVSNCDDHATAIVALAITLGHGAGFRTVKGDPSRPDEWSHVYPIVGIRERGIPRWIPIDTTEVSNPRFGQDPPGADRVPQKNWVIAPA
jgi:hypothetical protein